MRSATQTSVHLRVRLPKDDKDFLLFLAKQHKGRPNISRIIKQLIENARQNSYTVALDVGAQKKLKSMAQILRRTPTQVISDAIDAVESLVKRDEPPLLVMELKLIKNHQKRTAMSSS